jgi:ATP-dependent DNA helicase RecG
LEKHLWDKFYLENDMRVSLRNIIIREILVNTLMHREFTSSYYARFIIEKDRMYTENANRAVTGGVITPDNCVPNSKNPTIAAFFRNIWMADELGSGVRKLHHYVPLYSGQKPEMIDGDVFRVIIPLDNEYSHDVEMDKKFGVNDGVKFGVNGTKGKILSAMQLNPQISAMALAKDIGVTKRAIEKCIRELKEAGLIIKLVFTTGSVKCLG